MKLVGVRSTASDDGLVAVLLEEGGPGMLAAPLTAREGLSLSSLSKGLPPSWLPLLGRCLEAAAAAVCGTVLDVGPDGESLASLRVANRDLTEVMVHCTPGEALILAAAGDLEIAASDRLLSQQGVDLDEPSVHESVARMRAQLDQARVDDFLP